MLIVTCSEGCDATLTFRLEGKLLQAWVAEFESAYRSSQVSPDHVCLDLRALTFVDAEGARFLGNLIREGARVTTCSGFVAEMLHLERP